MKKVAFFILLACLTLGSFAKGKQLSALYGCSTFLIPDKNAPYVETYLNFNAWSLNFAKEDGQYRATVEVVLVVRKNDTVAYLKKYDLNSPYIQDSAKNDFTFMDIQRFALSNGIYDIEISLRDKNSDNEAVVMQDKLLVYFKEYGVSMSNIQLMASATPTTSENMLSRNGYDMVPYIDNFVPESISTLHPYVEIYNLDKAVEQFDIVTYISQRESGRMVPNTKNAVHRKNSGRRIAYYGNVDVSNFPSGNYDVVVEAVDQDGVVLANNRMPIQRSNPNVNDDSQHEMEVATSFVVLMDNDKKLGEYIDALYPIASPDEVTVADELVKSSSLTEKQNFFYHFWVIRNNIDPEGEWLKYKERVDYVEKNFSYPMTPGRHTDQGRVYLKYGPPDYIRDEKNFVGALYLNSTPTRRLSGNISPEYANNVEATAGQGHIYYLPYQLWRYNQLPADESNRVFLFWDQYRSGFYKLLNSNARGELQMPKWERMLSQNQLGEDVIGEVGDQFMRGY